MQQLLEEKEQALALLQEMVKVQGPGCPAMPRYPPGRGGTGCKRYREVLPPTPPFLKLGLSMKFGSAGRTCI